MVYEGTSKDRVRLARAVSTADNHAAISSVEETVHHRAGLLKHVGISRCRPNNFAHNWQTHHILVQGGLQACDETHGSLPDNFLRQWLLFLIRFVELCGGEDLGLELLLFYERASTEEIVYPSGGVCPLGRNF